MSRATFYEQSDAFFRGQQSNKVRIFSDSEHVEAFSFLEAYDSGNIKPSEPKHRRWISNFLFEDYGSSKKLVRRDSRRDVVKKSDIIDKITTSM